MHVFHKLEDIASEIPSSAVAIGNFDGCHLGHVALLKEMGEHAKRAGLAPTVLTFYPHPVEVLKPGKPLARLMTTSEKLSALKTLGVEFVLVAPFDQKLASLSPADFFQTYLQRGLNAKSVHVGFDFRFGNAREGNVEKLGQLCTAAGVHLGVLKAFERQGTRISSSSIRKLIGDGRIAEAGKLLGRPYWVTGQVTTGDHRGESLGFPTANINVPSEKQLPGRGVYLTRVEWQKQWFRSVTNVGVRPTFHAGEERSVVECHVIDFKARLYDEFLKIEFYDRIRDEMKFSDVNALKEQIAKDVAYARDSQIISE